MSENRITEFGKNHIVQCHMLHMQCQQKSFFPTTTTKYILAMVEETMKRLATTSPHKYKRQEESNGGDLHHKLEFTELLRFHVTV